MSSQIHHLCEPGMGPHPQCYIPSTKAIDLLVPEKEILMRFTLCGHGGHLGKVTINICYKFTPLNLWSLHMKFEFNWPSGF